METEDLLFLIHLLELVRNALARAAGDLDDDDLWEGAQRLADLISDLRACLG